MENNLKFKIKNSLLFIDGIGECMAWHRKFYKINGDI